MGTPDRIGVGVILVVMALILLEHSCTIRHLSRSVDELYSQ